jgi:hypothetical protein
MSKMTKEELKENNPNIDDVNAAWRKDELLPGTISGNVPAYPREKQLALLQQAVRKPALDAGPKKGALNAFGMFGGDKKPTSSSPSSASTPTKKQ